jgi:hypothetical protein
VFGEQLSLSLSLALKLCLLFGLQCGFNFLCASGEQ